MSIAGNKRETFLNIEKSLFVNWSNVLERAKKGTTHVYCMALAGMSEEEMSDVLNCDVDSIRDCLSVLDSMAFICIDEKKKSDWKYTLLKVPSFKKSKHYREEVQEEQTKAIFKPDKSDALTQLYIEKAETILAKLEEKTKEWNCNDILKYYAAVYTLHYKKKPRDTATMRERSNMKRMIDDYAWDVTRDAVKWAVENWSELKTKDEYPSVFKIFTLREQIVPMSQDGRVRSRGQYDGTKKKRGLEW